MGALPSAVPPAARHVYRPCLLVLALVGVLIAWAGIAVAEVKILNVFPPPEDFLRRAVYSHVQVDVSYNVRGTSILELWIEKYPSGSGCTGDIHQTNGGDQFPVSGEQLSRFMIPWFGTSRGTGYRDGFLRVGARLEDDTDLSRRCIRFGQELPTRHADDPGL
jgi:hypothetical protein